MTKRFSGQVVCSDEHHALFQAYKERKGVGTDEALSLIFATGIGRNT